jgi:Tfp pilus assembly protein PilF
MLTNERNKRLFNHAMSYYSEEKLGMSIDLLDEILSSDPDDKLALLTRGSIYVKMGNSKKRFGILTGLLISIPRMPEPTI